MSHAEADPLFTIDVVREFMISQGGKVNNHTLVTHFKSFLNDSNRKAANRLKFKEYVNTLSTIKLDTSGEKLLMLKKKFRSFTGADLAKPAPTSGASERPDKSKLDGAKFAKMHQKQKADKVKALEKSPKSASDGDLTRISGDEKENKKTSGSCDDLLDIEKSEVNQPEEEKYNSSNTLDNCDSSITSDSRFVSPPREDNKPSNQSECSDVNLEHETSDMDQTTGEDINDSIDMVEVEAKSSSDVTLPPPIGNRLYFSTSLFPSFIIGEINR